MAFRRTDQLRTAAVLTAPKTNTKLGLYPASGRIARVDGLWIPINPGNVLVPLASDCERLPISRLISRWDDEVLFNPVDTEHLLKCFGVFLSHDVRTEHSGQSQNQQHADR